MTFITEVESHSYILVFIESFRSGLSCVAVVVFVAFPLILIKLRSGVFFSLSIAHHTRVSEQLLESVLLIVVFRSPPISSLAHLLRSNTTTEKYLFSSRIKVFYNKKSLDHEVHCANNR